MANECSHRLHVRGRPADITRWLHIATAPCATYFAGEEAPESAWRVFHNLFPVPSKLLAKIAPEGAERWQVRNWDVNRYVLGAKFVRDAGREAYFDFYTASRPALKWVAKVASDFPELAFELYWRTEGHDDYLGRNLYQGGKCIENWNGNARKKDRMLSARVRSACGPDSLVIELMDAEIAKHPDNAEAYLLRAKMIAACIHAFGDPNWWTEEEDRDPNQRTLDLKRAIELDPQLLDAYLELARDCSKQGDVTEARKFYRRATEQCPDNACAFVEYARFLRQLPDQTGADIKRIRRTIRLAREHDPNNARALIEDACLFISRGDDPRAETALARALELNPAFDLALYARALCQVRLDAFVEAQRSLDDLAVWNPFLGSHFNGYVLLARGRCLANTGRVTEAIECFTQCLKAPHPKDKETFPEALLDRAECYSKRDRYSKAVADTRRAIRLAPESAHCRARLARHLILSGDFREACDALFAIGESDLTDQPIAVLLECLFDLRSKGRDDRAHTAAIMSIALAPNHWLPRRERAAILATSLDPTVRNGKEAVKVARRACKLSNWTEATCLSAYAAALAECGRFTEAVKWQQNALDRTPRGSLRDECRRWLVEYQNDRPNRYTTHSPN